MQIQALNEAQIRHIYDSRLKVDFPPNERKPLAAILRRRETGDYVCLGLAEGEALLGYAFFACYEKNYLLDYFAVDASRRDEGIGSAFLRLLFEHFRGAESFIIETEDPDYAPDAAALAVRERRLRFYRRNGFVSCGLGGDVFGTDYLIMEHPSAATHTYESLRAIYAGFYRRVLDEAHFRAFIHLR